MRPTKVSDCEILTHARACFLEHGPSVSTTVIAGGLGISQATLFKRFGTKEELMVAVLAPPPEPEWLDALREGPRPDVPVPDQLLEFTERILEFFEWLMPGMAVLRMADIDMKRVMERYPVPPPIRARQLLADWFARAQAMGLCREVDPTSAATAFLGALHGRVFMGHLGNTVQGSVDARVYTRQLVDLLWMGIAPEGDR